MWTVNDEPTIRYLLACGVDGIITDRPDTTRAAVERALGKKREAAAEPV